METGYCWLGSLMPAKGLVDFESLNGSVAAPVSAHRGLTFLEKKTHMTGTLDG